MLKASKNSGGQILAESSQTVFIAGGSVSYVTPENSWHHQMAFLA